MAIPVGSWRSSESLPRFQCPDGTMRISRVQFLPRAIRFRPKAP